MARTIHTAIAHLPASVQSHLLAQWNRCEALDIYDGDLNKYLLVIEQEMQRAFDTLAQTTIVLETLQEGINMISSGRGRAPHPKVTLQVSARRVFYLPEHIGESDR